MAQENFKRAAKFTMSWEGGDKVSDHPADPGGVTKYGISQRAYPALDIRSLTEEQALELYRQDYWDRVRCDELSWPLDIALFDYAFNSGQVQAVKSLQDSLRVNADGWIGPKTMAAIAQHEPTAIAKDLLAHRLSFLGNLAGWKSFGLGWARRILALHVEVMKV